MSATTSRTILLATIGSAGDVYPMLALARGLRGLGHKPVLVGYEVYSPLAAREGVRFVPLGTAGDYRQVLENPDLWHPTKGYQTLVQGGIAPNLRPFYDIIAKCDPQHTLVVATGFLFAARMAHEKLGMPWVTVHLQPALFRSAYDVPVLGGAALPDWLPPGFKRLYYRLLDRLLLDRVLGPPVNAMRRELELPACSHLLGSDLHAPQGSLGLFPDWFAPRQPDWPPQLLLTGFLQYEDETPLPAELVTFLEAGEAPLVFTAGTSMRHGAGFFATSTAAAQMLGRRAVMVTGHAAQVPRRLPPGILHVPFAPFARLLPHAAALVHHGGIGTAAAALAAGIPQLVMPLSMDQPDNARRLARLGVAAHISPRRYRPAAVAGKLHGLLTSPAVRDAATAIAQRVDFAGALDKSLKWLTTGS